MSEPSETRAYSLTVDHTHSRLRQHRLTPSRLSSESGKIQDFPIPRNDETAILPTQFLPGGKARASTIDHGLLARKDEHSEFAAEIAQYFTRRQNPPYEILTSTMTRLDASDTNATDSNEKQETNQEDTVTSGQTFPATQTKPSPQIARVKGTLHRKQISLGNIQTHQRFPSTDAAGSAGIVHNKALVTGQALNESNGDAGSSQQKSLLTMAVSTRGLTSSQGLSESGSQISGGLHKELAAKQLKHLWIAVGPSGRRDDSQSMSSASVSVSSSLHDTSAVFERNSIRVLLHESHANPVRMSDEAGTQRMAHKEFDGFMSESDDNVSYNDDSSSDSDIETQQNSPASGVGVPIKNSGTSTPKAQHNDESPKEYRRRFTDRSLFHMPMSSYSNSLRSTVLSDKIFGAYTLDITVFFTPFSYDDPINVSLNESESGPESLASTSVSSLSKNSTALVPNYGYKRPKGNSVNEGKQSMPIKVGNENKEPEYTTRKRLQKLYNMYQASISKKDSIKKEINKKLVSKKQEIQEELSQLIRWRAVQTIHTYRTYSQHQILSMSLRIQLLGMSINEMHKITEQISILLKEKQNKYTIPQLPEPAGLMKDNPEYSRIKKEIEFIDEKLSMMGPQWILLKKMIISPTAIRYNFIREILLSTQHSLEVGFHVNEKNMQDYFEKLVLDERTTEGKRIRQLIVFLSSKGPETVNPSDVSLFLNDLGEQILAECKLNEEKERSALRLYLYRTVYPRIIEFCRLYETEEEYDSDLALYKKKRWIDSLTYKQMDVSLNFFDNEEAAKRCFEKTSNVLTQCGLECVPTDMLHHIYTAAKLIASSANQNMAKGMGADDFFPVYIYAVARADIPSIHRCIGFMKRFSSPNERVSELAYCLTSLEAAVYHLSSLTQEIVDLKK